MTASADETCALIDVYRNTQKSKHAHQSIIIGMASLTTASSSKLCGHMVFHPTYSLEKSSTVRSFNIYVPHRPDIPQVRATCPHTIFPGTAYIPHNVYQSCIQQLPTTPASTAVRRTHHPCTHRQFLSPVYHSSTWECFSCKVHLRCSYTAGNCYSRG